MNNKDENILDGWPSQVNGPLVWDGNTRPGQDAHTVYLAEGDHWALAVAFETLQRLEVGGEDISRENFPLSNHLERKLDNASWDLHEGAGYAIIKGIDVENYSAEDHALLYLGLSDYIGRVRGVQNRHGDVLTHVTVAETWDDVPEEKRHGLHTNQALPPHHDMGAEILCLAYRARAAEGGATYIVSSWRIYNDLASEYPDVLKALATPDWPIQVSGQDARYILAPLIAYHDSKILMNFDPGRLGAHPDFDDSAREGAGIPSLTPAQFHALDVVNHLAQKHRVKLDLQPGDFVFINNWALLHGREAYTDGDTHRRRRHLVRMWIRNPERSWKVPENMRFAWELAYSLVEDEAKEGYVAQRRRYDVVPVPKYKIPQYTAGSACFLIDDDVDGEAEKEQQ